MHCEFTTVLNVENYVYMKNMYQFPCKGQIYSLVFTICQEKKLTWRLVAQEIEDLCNCSMKIDLGNLNFQLPTALFKANGKHI